MYHQKKTVYEVDHELGDGELSQHSARACPTDRSRWAAMNKIFIYARPCVNKDFFHDDVFSCVFRRFS